MPTDRAPEGRGVVERRVKTRDLLESLRDDGCAYGYSFERGACRCHGCTAWEILTEGGDATGGRRRVHDPASADVAPAGSEQAGVDGSARETDSPPPASLLADSAIHALAKGVAQATIEKVHDVIHDDETDIGEVFLTRHALAQELADITMACADEDPESEVHALRAVRPPVETQDEDAELWLAVILEKLTLGEVPESVDGDEAYTSHDFARHIIRRLRAAPSSEVVELAADRKGVLNIRVYPYQRVYAWWGDDEDEAGEGNGPTAFEDAVRSLMEGDRG